ncbi:MAG: amidophosphoribosyltransferase [Acidobacteria bacterium]|nr:amidophosphoribosyltransferase [Acidobacteriota bacterium]
MCGIAGLFSKTSDFEAELGDHMADMLIQMADRGPDSAGVAFYRNPVPEGWTKLTLFSPDDDEDWGALSDSLAARFGAAGEPEVRATHAVIAVEADAAEAAAWVIANRPDLRLMSAGRSIEIYKEKGSPVEFVERFGLRDISASHGLGHTRMATESFVTTEHSHPFSSGLDICLVHNGSLSNHNRLREVLRREGLTIQTDNDSEVASAYLTWKMSEGLGLEDALKAAIEDLDGFYTFAVGTADGFAVLRDPIGCKPAVMSESEDWVAMASEYRAIAVLPGAEEARVWEPSPGQIYVWDKAAIA